MKVRAKYTPRMSVVKLKGKASSKRSQLRLAKRQVKDLRPYIPYCFFPGKPSKAAVQLFHPSAGKRVYPSPPPPRFFEPFFCIETDERALTLTNSLTRHPANRRGRTELLPSLPYAKSDVATQYHRQAYVNDIASERAD